MSASFRIERGEGPMVAAAIHAGHRVRAEVRQALRLDAEERRREEDPWTDRLTRIAPTRILALRSRFEVDFNRPRAGAVYRRPEDAWGLRVWKDPAGPSEELVRRARAEHDRFYDAVREQLEEKARRHGTFVVYDLHSYNHRRNGPAAPPAAAPENPDINVGTATMERERWAPVLEALIETLRGRRVGGRPLDVRENVRFFGGRFPRWIHDNFPAAGCAPALELKKTFMDEWTGELLIDRLRELEQALRATVGPVTEALERCRVPSR